MKYLSIPPALPVFQGKSLHPPNLPLSSPVPASLLETIASCHERYVSSAERALSHHDLPLFWFYARMAEASHSAYEILCNKNTLEISVSDTPADVQTPSAQ